MNSKFIPTYEGQNVNIFVKLVYCELEMYTV